jgi:hypothetical protein
MKGERQNSDRLVQCIGCNHSGKARWGENAEPQKNNGRCDRVFSSVPDGFRTTMAPRVGEGQTLVCKTCGKEAFGI